MATAQIELPLQGSTFDGYSFLVFAKGRGKRRRFWWHCGSCWEESSKPTRYEEDVRDDFMMHAMVCPGSLIHVEISVVPAQT